MRINRKSLKANARKTINLNYIPCICICCIMLLFAGRYTLSAWAINSYDEAGQTAQEIYSRINTSSNWDYFTDIFDDKENDSDEDAPPLPRVTINDQAITSVEVTEIASQLFNSIVNNEGYAVKFVNGATNLFKTGRVPRAVINITFAILEFLVFLFIQNILYIGERRFYMETRTYKRTRIGRILYLFKSKNFFHVAWVMLARTIFNALWYLTIVGGIVKYYEYRMIPFILAEDSSIDRKTAFKASKELMNGNKWEMFKLDLSFILWDLLTILTFGLVGILYANPYNIATKTEFYLAVRRNAINTNSKYSYAYTDKYIDPINDNDVEEVTEQLAQTYLKSDVVEMSPKHFIQKHIISKVKKDSDKKS